MKQENIEFLEANKHHCETVTKAGYVKHLNAHEREGMLRVMREEFIPGYTVDLWCPPCLFDMVKLLYSQYEKWQQQNPIKVHETFPENDKPDKNVQLVQAAEGQKKKYRRKR